MTWKHFRFAVCLWEESAGHRRIALTDNNSKFWRFLCCAPEQTVWHAGELPAIWIAITVVWRHDNAYGGPRHVQMSPWMRRHMSQQPQTSRPLSHVSEISGQVRPRITQSQSIQSISMLEVKVTATHRKVKATSVKSKHDFILQSKGSQFNFHYYGV